MAAEIVSILRGILSNLHYESRDVKDAVEREGYCLDCLSSLDECREHCMTCGTRRCCTHDAPTGSAEEWEEAKAEAADAGSESESKDTDSNSG